MLHPGRTPIYERGGDARRLAQGCKFRVQSYLGCFWQNAIIFSCNGLFQDCTRRNTNKLFVCVLKWSFLGVKTGLGNAQIGLLDKGNGVVIINKLNYLIQNFRRASKPFHMGVPPGLLQLTSRSRLLRGRVYVDRYMHEGLNGVNHQRQTAKNITDYRQNEKNCYRLPAGKLLTDKRHGARLQGCF